MGQLNTGTLDLISQEESPPGILKENVDMDRLRRPTDLLQQPNLIQNDEGRFQRTSNQSHQFHKIHQFHHTRLRIATIPGARLMKSCCLGCNFSQGQY